MLNPDWYIREKSADSAAKNLVKPASADKDLFDKYFIGNIPTQEIFFLWKIFLKIFPENTWPD